LFNLIKKLTKEMELFLDLRSLLSWIPHLSYTRNFERARLREFHPLELNAAKAAPHHGVQPGHLVAR
jgi:hypothetical protein